MVTLVLNAFVGHTIVHGHNAVNRCKLSGVLQVLEMPLGNCPSLTLTSMATAWTSHLTLTVYSKTLPIKHLLHPPEMPSDSLCDCITAAAKSAVCCYATVKQPVIAALLLILTMDDIKSTHTALRHPFAASSKSVVKLLACRLSAFKDRSLQNTCLQALQCLQVQQH